MQGHYGNNGWRNEWINARWTTQIGPKKALPPVREILSGTKKDPYFTGKCGYDVRVSQDVADQFNQCLVAFEKNNDAPFKQYPILRQYMPVKEVPVKKPAKPKFDKAQMDDYLKQLDEDKKKEKSFFQAYKPTFKSLLFGAALGGISYWLYNKEDRHEARRRMKAQASR